MVRTVAARGLMLSCVDAWGWTGGIVPDPLKKDVRLEVQDAALPWVEPGSLVFPLSHYRWHASNYQHTFLAIAVNQTRLYYHRAEDMGMIPDLEQVLSMTDGTILKAPGTAGDGESNSVVVEDLNGLAFWYDHMNAMNIVPALKPGVSVRRGDKLGLTGNTWRGQPVSDPHLHAELRVGEPVRDTFPLIVSAYLTTYPGSVLPVAGGWRHLWVNGTIALGL